jgi:hypothetical protein
VEGKEYEFRISINIEIYKARLQPIAFEKAMHMRKSDCFHGTV